MQADNFVCVCVFFFICLSMSRGSHIGAMICKAVQDKSIDFLVMGRRGMNRFSRLIAGSNSRYCMENADCNVIIVKGE